MNLTGEYTNNTPEQLARYRANAQYDYAEHLARTDGSPSEANAIIFTCDTCPDAPRCPYVYDLYNTNGDCLAEK